MSPLKLAFIGLALIIAVYIAAMSTARSASAQAPMDEKAVAHVSCVLSLAGQHARSTRAGDNAAAKAIQQKQISHGLAALLYSTRGEIDAYVKAAKVEINTQAGMFEASTGPLSAEEAMEFRITLLAPYKVACDTLDMVGVRDPKPMIIECHRRALDQRHIGKRHREALPRQIDQIEEIFSTGNRHPFRHRAEMQGFRNNHRPKLPFLISSAFRPDFVQSSI